MMWLPNRLLVSLASVVFVYVSLALAEERNSLNDYDQNKIKDENARSKRATGSDLDDESFGSLKLSGRANPFLGKRAPRYMLGKRPRNNFLGKRDDGSSLTNSIPLIDYLQEENEKRARSMPFLGKRLRPSLGKRSNTLYEDSPFYDEDSEILDAEKRERWPYYGKRLRPLLGKRAGRMPFLGKRDFNDNDDAELFYDGLADEADKRARMPFLGKRARMPFLGKRGRMPMLGKREFDEEEVKRAARYMLGKREDDLESDRR